VFNVIAGIGQAGPLTLLVTYVQFTAPHAFLATATGLAFSARAIGGALGTAVLSAIVNGHISSSADSTPPSKDAYAAAYRLAWASIIPLVVVALVCSACLGSVKSLMTERVEASVEPKANRESETNTLGSGAMEMNGIVV
jgi:hypothetical protein